MTHIRKFFVIFTLAYVYLAVIEDICTIFRDGDSLTGDPFSWPIGVQVTDFSIMLFYDIIGIGFLVSVHQPTILCLSNNLGTPHGEIPGVSADVRSRRKRE